MAEERTGQSFIGNRTPSQAVQDDYAFAVDADDGPSASLFRRFLTKLNARLDKNGPDPTLRVDTLIDAETHRPVNGVLSVVTRRQKTERANVAVNGVVEIEAAGGNAIASHFQAVDRMGSEGSAAESLVAQELGVVGTGPDMPVGQRREGVRRILNITPNVEPSAPPDTDFEAGCGIMVSNEASFFKDVWRFARLRFGMIIEDRKPREKGSPHSMHCGLLVDTSGHFGVAIRGNAKWAVHAPRGRMAIREIVLGTRPDGSPATIRYNPQTDMIEMK